MSQRSPRPHLGTGRCRSASRACSCKARYSTPGLVDDVRHKLHASGFIVVREEQRDLTKEIVSKLASGISPETLIGKTYAFVVARDRCALDLLEFVQGSECASKLFACPNARAAAEAVVLLFPRLSIDALPTNSEARDYVNEHLKATLIQGLSEVVKTKPKNSIEWLARFLLERNHQAPVVKPGPAHTTA